MSTAKQVTRFSVPQRIEHWVMVLSFTVLAVTGLPQKFAGDGWAETMIGLMGGIDLTRQIHHIAAIVLLLGGIYHIISLLYKVVVLRVRWTIFPQLQDAVDAFNAFLFNLGFRKEEPQFDRFSWGEKFEYWALIWGTVIMAITGFMLWNPIITSRFVQGELIPAAKAAHGGEAILAVLAVVIWHFYNVHIKTFNKAMFTGKLSAHEMEQEHGLELAKLAAGEDGRTTDPVKIRRRQRVYLPIAAVAALALLFGIFLFTTAETTAVTTIRRQPGATVQIYAPQPKTLTPVRAAAQPATGGAPALPADHVGRTSCQACHATGAAGPQYPADHAGRADATCQDCHKPAGAPAGAQETATAASAGTATATATATATTAATTAAETATTAPSVEATATTAPAATSTTAPTGGIPGIPAGHPTAGCTACHSTGAAGAPMFPANHSSYTDQTCTTCHKPQ